jgi:translation initiation factor 5
LIDILKFLSIELGTQFIYTKKGKDVTCILKGEKEEEQVSVSLEKFIGKYVICPKCGLPEIFLKVEGGKVRSKCNSCGADSLLDNKHQVAAFIVKNPPKNKMEIIGA